MVCNVNVFAPWKDEEKGAVDIIKLVKEQLKIKNGAVSAWRFLYL